MFHRRHTAPPPLQLGCAISRHDFIDSLRLLGARMNVSRPCRVGAVEGETQEISLNCPRDVWERVVGPPRNIVCHYSPSRRGLYHSWEHCWTGGSVKCFGCLFERAANSHWLFLSRVLFLDHPSDSPRRHPLADVEAAEPSRQPA